MQAQQEPTVPQSKITIHYGSQRDGYVFRLDPLSLLWLKDNYPNQNRIDSVLIGYDKRHTPNQIAESIWGHISQLLTGFSINEINQLGGFVVVHPVTGEVIYHSLLVHA